MNKQTRLQLNHFFPETLGITSIEETDNQLTIQMKSLTKTSQCPKCHEVCHTHHNAYVRKVQDLPILGKTVFLEITTYSYDCPNLACHVKTITEDYTHFLSAYSRMTERCMDFICMLALETSCESCAKICRKIGIQTSGDTVIRLLTKKFEAQEPPAAADTIGVDDFAFKKRKTYGTIIVDEKTHQPIAVLDGRDGKTLKEWLTHNKQVKTVTRDRASAYAKVLSEELPDVMQIADRFHLHQNLLEAIKKALNQAIPAMIKIPSASETNDHCPTENDESLKKTKCDSLFASANEKATTYSTNTNSFKART